jgi:hypothetical protein
MAIFDLLGSQGIGQGTAIELGVAPGARDRPHVDQEPDARLGQDRQQLVDRTGGVPDGEESARAASRG